MPRADPIDPALIAEWLREADALAKALAKGSTLEDEAAKRTLSESTAYLITYLKRHLIPAGLTGDLSGEVRRTIPGINQNIRHNLALLHLTNPVKEELPDLFGMHKEDDPCPDTQ